MAIVVEEQRNAGATGLVSLFLWLALLVACGVGLYYVFFKQPDLVPIAANANFKTTEQIAKISLHPEVVVGKIQAFQSYVTIVPPTAAPRTNPFLGL
jgi:hypothetical protein